MPEDIKIRLSAEGAAETRKTLDEVALAAGGVADQTQRSGEAAGRAAGGLAGMGAAARGLGDQLIGLGAGFVTLQTAISLIGAFNERLTQTQVLLAGLAQQSFGEQLTSRALAFTLGVPGQAGIEQAQALGGRATEALGLPADQLAAGQAFVSTAISVFPEMEPQAAAELGIALAPAIGATGVGGGEAAALLSLAAQTGARDLPSAQLAVAQVLAAQRKSIEGAPGAFFQGAVSGVVPSVAAGLSREQSLRLFTMLRAVSESSAVAGTRQAGILRELTSPSKELLDIVGRDFEGQDIGGRLEAVEKLFASATPQERLGLVARLGGSQAVQAMATVFRPEVIAGAAPAEAAIGAASAADVIALGESLAEQTTAMAASAEAERRERQRAMAREVTLGQEIRKQAEERILNLERQGRGPINIWGGRERAIAREEVMLLREQLQSAGASEGELEELGLRAGPGVRLQESAAGRAVLAERASEFLQQRGFSERQAATFIVGGTNYNFNSADARRENFDVRNNMVGTN